MRTLSTLPRRRLVTLTLFVASFAALLLFYSRHPLLYDTDSYYHLAIGRAYAQQGVIDGLPWARFSVMHQGFGDKELLFHLLLAPFARMPDPLLGGRIALALLDALLLTALGWLAMRAIGPWGWAVPFGLVLVSAELAWRLVRLRPELLSLLLLLAVLWTVASRRYRWLGVLAAVYALSYTAFHALLGLCFLLFLFFGWARRRWEPGLLLYPLLGMGLGLVLHPHFPRNLAVWVVQSVYFFFYKGTLDVGSEIRPNFTDVTLMVNLGWFLALAALWRSARPAGEGEEALSRAADAFGIAALAFGGLYLLMSRFAIYFFPFATLWLLFEMRRRGYLPGKRVALPGRRSVPLAAALIVSVLLGLPEAGRQLQTFARRTSPGPGAARLVDRQAVARALPRGAKVAAPWESTPVYMFAAPWASYLNVLDPVFMAVPHPRLYDLQRSVFAGEEPDVPLAVAGGLDSDFLAVPLRDDTRRLAQRLSGDPRVETLYRGFNGVFRMGPAPGHGFVMDWKAAPPSSLMPPAPYELTELWPAYPRLKDERARSLEGYIDARRLTGGQARCAGLVHEVEVENPARAVYELAPSGPSTLWLDGRLLASTSGSLGAVLGRGIRVEADLGPGRHRIAVSTCPEDSPAARSGFYLLERRRAPQ
ncbi:MAG TPA: hypothetical protein VMW27_00770 [Thermoanaerobaculia bacterium]|nr:hypothetical protein [Thermoanaerobaculia bacterium]